MTTQPAELTAKTRSGKPPTFKFAYSFILLDYYLRWVLYGLWRFHLIPGWLFWTSQVLIISTIVVVWVALRNENTKEKYKLSPELASPQPTLLATLLSLGGVLIGTYITSTLFIGWSLWVR